jgi:DnaJ family protein C protein 11
MNLPKTATAGEIKDRYRILAVAFHPDKHRAIPASSLSSQNTSTDGPAAEHQFARIQHAYSILSDPHKRAVYDMLGEQGLREIGDNEEGQEGSNGRTGWKVIRRLGSPDEVSSALASAQCLRHNFDTASC